MECREKTETEGGSHNTCRYPSGETRSFSGKRQMHQRVYYMMDYSYKKAISYSHGGNSRGSTAEISFAWGALV